MISTPAQYDLFHYFLDTPYFFDFPNYRELVKIFSRLRGSFKSVFPPTTLIQGFFQNLDDILLLQWVLASLPLEHSSPFKIQRRAISDEDSKAFLEAVFGAFSDFHANNLVPDSKAEYSFNSKVFTRVFYAIQNQVFLWHRGIVKKGLFKDGRL